MVIAFDFVGIVVKNDYPKIGETIPLALETLKHLTMVGHKLILCMSFIDNNKLENAIEYFKYHSIELYGINENPEFKFDGNHLKIYADLYISIFNFGCPIIKDECGIEFFDWSSFIRDTKIFSNRIKKRLLTKRCENCNEITYGIDLQCYSKYCKGFTYIDD